MMQPVDTGDYVTESLKWRVRARNPHVTRAERRETVQRLRALRAQASQNYVIDWLQLHRVPFRSFWIANTVYVPNAPADIVATLAKRPDVLRVRLNGVAATIEPVVRKESVRHPRVFSPAARTFFCWGPTGPPDDSHVRDANLGLGLGADVGVGVAVGVGCGRGCGTQSASSSGTLCRSAPMSHGRRRAASRWSWPTLTAACAKPTRLSAARTAATGATTPPCTTTTGSTPRSLRATRGGATRRGRCRTSAAPTTRSTTPAM